MSDAHSLQGFRVLVTRPAAQAESLCQMIEARGAAALRFPTLEIQGPADPDSLWRALDDLERSDWAVFVSANAVDGALDALAPGRKLPVALKLAVVGGPTARVLERRGYRVDACPTENFSSEGLLAHPAMQAVAGQRFAIFRGNGGRDELARVLAERGAVCAYVEAYRRARPVTDARRVTQLGVRGGVDFVLANSAESLENLWEMLDGERNAWVAHVQLIIPSLRLVPVAARRGFVKPPLVAENATDQAMIDALVEGCARLCKSD